MNVRSMPKGTPIRRIVRALILSAIGGELGSILDSISEVHPSHWGRNRICTGNIGNVEVVVMATGVGKVRAACAVQYGIDIYQPDIVVLVGAAGSINPTLHIGHTIVARRLVEHDFDVHAFSPRLQREKRWTPSTELVELGLDAARRVFGHDNVQSGVVLTGDQAIMDPIEKGRLRNRYDGDCVEMEGAAVAAVSTINDIPYLVVRLISDNADDLAATNFRNTLPDLADRSSAFVSALLSEDGRLAKVLS